jgi:hypothetical protein
VVRVGQAGSSSGGMSIQTAPPAQLVPSWRELASAGPRRASAPISAEFSWVGGPARDSPACHPRADQDEANLRGADQDQANVRGCRWLAAHGRPWGHARSAATRAEEAAGASSAAVLLRRRSAVAWRGPLGRRPRPRWHALELLPPSSMDRSRPAGPGASQPLRSSPPEQSPGGARKRQSRLCWSRCAPEARPPSPARTLLSGQPQLTAALRLTRAEVSRRSLPAIS